jgi:hypothetical protein
MNAEWEHVGFKGFCPMCGGRTTYGTYEKRIRKLTPFAGYGCGVCGKEYGEREGWRCGTCDEIWHVCKLSEENRKAYMAQKIIELMRMIVVYKIPLLDMRALRYAHIRKK